MPKGVGLKIASAVAVAAPVVGTAAFAAGEDTVVITSGMLQPLLDAITTNAGVILPVGLSIMGILVGISLIPRLIYKFF